MNGQLVARFVDGEIAASAPLPADDFAAEHAPLGPAKVDAAALEGLALRLSEDARLRSAARLGLLDAVLAATGAALLVLACWPLLYGGLLSLPEGDYLLRGLPVGAQAAWRRAGGGLRRAPRAARPGACARAREALGR